MQWRQVVIWPLNFFLWYSLDARMLLIPWDQTNRPEWSLLDTLRAYELVTCHAFRWWDDEALTTPNDFSKLQEKCKCLLHNLLTFYFHVFYSFRVWIIISLLSHFAVAWKFQEKCGFVWITFKAKLPFQRMHRMLPSAQVEKAKNRFHAELKWNN